MLRFFPSSLRIRLVLLVLFALVPSFGLIVFTGWQEGVSRVLGLNLLLLALVGLLALATAAVGGDLLIMRPVRKLVDATKRLAAGDLSARADLHHGQEELNQLGRAFDQMAEALDRRERLMRELPSVVYTVILDRLERTLYISPQIEVMLGFSPAEWMGHLQLWAQQLHPDDRERALNERAYYRNIGGRFVSEYRLLSGSGRVVWVHDEGMVVRGESQEPPLLHGVMVDITERKQAEAQCQRLLQRTTVLREINAATISTLDLHSVLNLLLEKIDSLLDYAAATVRLLDRQTGELEPVACRNIDEEKWKTEMREYGWDPGKMAVENKILCNVQMPSCIKNCLSVGGNGQVSCLGLPLVAKNEVLGILCLFTKAEHRFSNEEIELLSLLAGEAAIAIYNSQLYEQTKKQALELEEAHRERADFTAMIVHDLSSPLTTVISGATMLEEGAFGPVNEEQRKWLVKIGASGCRVQTFVSKFLDLSRIESGHIELNKERTDLKELIENSLANYLLLARDKKLFLKISIDPKIAWIEADPRRLDQLLGHLLSNAVKFTKEGGEIEVGAAQLSGDEIKVWVRDNGSGISPQEIGGLFEIYRKPTNGSSSKLERRGIGLIICKMIVEAHGGKIWVESEEGKGSSFFFSLPRTGQ